MLIKNIVFLLFIIISGILSNNIYPQDNYSHAGENQSNEHYYAWLKNSTSKSDTIINEYFNAIDFEEKINAITYISKREDKNFSLLLDNTYYHQYDNKNEKEYILFLMIDNFFKDEKAVKASGDSFFLICNNIASYSHSTLRKKIMEKTVFMDKKAAENILLKEALFLLDEGKKNNKFNKEMIEESRVFFIYSEKINSPVIADYRQTIYVTVSNIPYR